MFLGIEANNLHMLQASVNYCYKRMAVFFFGLVWSKNNKGWFDSSSFSVEQTAISVVKMFSGGLPRKWERRSSSCSVCWMRVQEFMFVMLLHKFFLILQGNLSLSLVKDVSRSKP